MYNNLYSSVKGTQGLTGLTGKQGIQGLTGLTGKQGIQGLTGLDGPIGPDGLQGIQGLTGLDGPIGPDGLQGIQGLTGLDGPIGPDGLQGIQGIQGLTGLDGPIGPDGLQGIQGLTGLDGPIGPDGLQGIQGLTGLDGPIGPDGLQGIQGIQGIQGLDGPAGQNAAIASIFVWSSLIQPNRNITYFQYVMFEQGLIGPSSWQTLVQPGYNYPTTFIVDSSGYYLITYKIDVRSGAGSSPTSSTDSSTVLTKNGIAIKGSATLVESPQENHIYTISNTVLCELSALDNVSLMFWSTDIGARIGDPSFIKGLLPNNNNVVEASASIVFTRITQ
jgi:hypothetical protein